MSVENWAWLIKINGLSFLQPEEQKYICFEAVNEWVELISDKASSSGTIGFWPANCYYY